MTKKTSKEIILTLEDYAENFNRSFEFKQEYWRYENKEWFGLDELIDLIETFGAQEKSLFDLYHYFKKEIRSEDDKHE